MARKKFYAVRKGKKNFVITDSWDECFTLVQGYSGAVFKGFSSQEEAEAWLYGTDRHYDGIPQNAIFADGAMSTRSQKAEARVTDINGKTLVYKDLGYHTNNYAELMALGLAVVYAIKNNKKVIYTDSQTALSWIISCNPSLSTRNRETIIKAAQKINALLKNNPGISIRPWDTVRYGQIPADFGRK